MKRAPSKLMRRSLSAYAAREVTPSEAARLEALIASQPELAQHVEALRTVQAQLESPLPGFDDHDLTEAVRAGLRASSARAYEQRPRPHWRLGWLAAGLATCALLGLLFTRAPDASGFRARSAAPAADEQARAVARWTGVRVYAREQDGKMRPLARVMQGDQPLSFRCLNLGPRPFPYLMVFAVDSNEEVRWYYPAYEEPNSNPSSLPIATGRTRLPDAVYHDLPRGRLRLHALFSPRALRVEEVEAWLRESDADARPLPWSNAFQQVIELTVE